MRTVAISALCLLALAGPVFAQVGRISGVVSDDVGQPVKGATIKAENPTATPGTVTATADDKGRFSMIGLQKGMWSFTVSARGYAPVQGRTEVSTLRPNPPIEFRLNRTAGGSSSSATGGAGSKELQAALESARAFVDAGQYDQAIAAYRTILEKTPTLTTINLEIGNAFRRKKDYDHAIEAYQEVLKTDPSNERARISVGMAYMEKGDLAKAEAALTDAAVAASAGREVFYSLGEVLFAQGKPEDAARWYQKAADADPTWVKPVFKLGMVAISRNDKDAAIKFLERVVAMDPASSEAGQAKAAIDQLKK
ncbi:MAG: tetratricopeptide repeat protein [Acidobacteria bacterium]|nr:tetratricopeptide repeat protein [Acidobacteriota bacterium]